MKGILIYFLLCLTILLGIENNNTVAFQLYSSIKVYKAPNSKIFNLPIKTIPKDQVVILYNERKGLFIRINYQGLEGWVDYNKLNVPDELITKLFNQKTISAKELNLNNKLSSDEQIKAEKKTIKEEVKPVQIELRKSLEKKKSKPNKTEPPTKPSKDDNKTSITNKTGKNIHPSGLINGYFIATFILSLLLAFLLIKTFLENRRLNKLYKPIIDIDQAVEERKKEVQKEKKIIEVLKSDYSGKKNIYDSLVYEIQLLKDDLDYMAHGLYKPRFDFDTAEQFKEKIKNIRQEQKTLIRNKEAVIIHTEWEISGSKVAGRKLTTRLTRIALRAFNGECDSIISKVKWNNVDRMKERIERSFNAINKMLETMMMAISVNYRNSKEDELFATHEYCEKKYEEKEEIRRVRAEEREEKKVLMEAEKARKEAEKKQKLYEDALATARGELGLLSDEEMEEKTKQIEQLEKKLQEALENKERAISQAQLTKSGHVYVISNIGSFGEDIYKIGLTRRLEPEIRVRELGDASVPFHFDIHAMMFSDDAPALERNLHEVFENKRVNLVNRRKEFFKVTLDEIEKEAKKINPDIKFYYTAESQEYKQTLALLKTKEEQLEELREQKSKFPDTI